MCRTVLQSVSYRAVVPNMQKTLKSQQLWRRQPSYKNDTNSHLIKDKNKHIKEKMSSPVCHGEGANENSEIPPYIHHSPTRTAMVPSADKTGFCESEWLQESSLIAEGGKRWCALYGRHVCNFLQKWDNHLWHNFLIIPIFTYSMKWTIMSIQKPPHVCWYQHDLFTVDENYKQAGCLSGVKWISKLWCI